MAWSTRELATLAGTTVNTIRHYHRLGLLEEPERRYNGYKQYEVRHLVRLLRVRRLADLGVPLAQIEAEDSAGEITSAALHEVDEELARNIEHLQHARQEIAEILRDAAPADVPTGFSSVASRLSEADSSIIHVYTRLYDEDALADLREMVETDDEALTQELNSLPPDANEETRQRIAEQLAVSIADNLERYPWLSDPGEHLAEDQDDTAQILVEAVIELYNPAQVDVLGRAAVLADKLFKAQDEGVD